MAGFADALIGMSPWGGKPAAAEAKRVQAQAELAKQQGVEAEARARATERTSSAQAALLRQQEAISAAQWVRYQPIIYAGAALVGALVFGWLLLRNR